MKSVFKLIIAILLVLKMQLSFGAIYDIYISGVQGATITLTHPNAGANWSVLAAGPACLTPDPGDNKKAYWNTTCSGIGVFEVRGENGANDYRYHITVTAPAPPIAYDVSGGGSYCFGGTGVLVGMSDSESGVNYQLIRDGSNVGLPVAGSGVPFSFGLMSIAGNYTVQATNAIIPALTTTMNGNALVIVNALPTVTAPFDYSVCSGDATALSGAGTADSYTWTGGVLNGIAFTPAATTTYTVTGTITATGCTATDGVTITVNPRPSITKTVNTANYCAGGAGGSITILASDAGVTYSLYNSVPLLEGSLVGGGNITFTGLPAETYTITAAYGTGCTSSFAGTFIITENPLPTVAPSVADADFCIGGSTQLNANALPLGGATITNYLWNNSTMLNNAAITNPTTDADLIATTTFTVTVTDNRGCVNTGNIAITVNPLPAVTFTLPATADNVCKDEAIFTLTSVTPAGGAFSGSAAIVGGNQFDPNLAAVGVNNITYTYTDVNGCTNSATDAIGVHALPVVGIVNLLPQQCDIQANYTIRGNIFPLVAPATGVFSFSGAAAGLVDNFNGSAQFLPGATGLGNHTVTYTYTDANGCSATVVEPTRVGTLLTFIDLNDHSCNDDGAFTFQYTPGDAVLPADWSVTTIPATVGLTGVGGGDAQFDPVLAGSGVYAFTYIFKDDIGCVNRLDKNVTITSTPVASITSLNATYCSNAPNDVINGLPAPVGSATGVFTTLIAGLTNNQTGTETFSPSTAPVGGPYDITYTYTDAFGCTDSDIKQVSIIQAPVVTLSGNATICAGLPTNLTFTFGASANYTVLYSDGTNSFSHSFVPADLDATFKATVSISPATSRTYSLVSVTNTTTGCTGIIAGSATIVVNPNVAITTNLVNITACQNGSATFVIDATGTGTLNYDWYLNAAVVPAQSGTSKTFSMNSLTLADDATTVYCIVSGGCGLPITSSIATLTVNKTTAISLNPASIAKCQGSSHTFSITTAGVNNIYQWQKWNGVAYVALADLAGKYSGTNTQNLQVLNLNTASDAGNYRCMVDGDCGPAVNSTAATLTIYNNISINTQPTSINACDGDDVQFVIATNDAPTYLNHTFEWFFDDGLGGGFVSTGNTNRILVLNNVDKTTQKGDYYCEVTSPCGEKVSSDIKMLNFYSDVVITNILTDKSSCENNTVYFNVNTTGDVLSYQWYKNTVATPVGVNSNTLELLNVTQLANGGSYFCIVNGQCNSPQSTTSILTIDSDFTISTHPQSKSVCVGTNTSLSVNVSVNSNQTYQWFKVGPGIIVGETSSILNFGTYAIADAGQYYCEVTNACQTRTSNIAALSTGLPASITSPALTAVNECTGQDIQLSITTAGTIDSIRWFKGGTMLFDGVRIINTQTVNLDILNIKPSDNGTYTCWIYGVCNNDNADFILTVSDSVKLTSSPVNDTVCEGQPVSLGFTHTGTGPFTYRWQKTVGAVSVADNLQTLSFPIPTIADQGFYYCEITNACNTSPVTTNNAFLKVEPDFTITDHPDVLTQCAGTTAVFSVTADVSGLSYQWQKNGVNLTNTAPFSGVNTPTLTISNITASEAADYRCQVLGICKTTYSNPAALMVNQPIVITLQPVGDTVCPGVAYNLLVSASGTGLNYEWFHGAASVGIGSVYSIAAFAPADAGTYYCAVTSSCGTVSSNTVTLYEGANTSINIPAPANLSLCEGSNASFAVNATGSNLNYQWRLESVSITDDGRIVGSKNSTLAVNSIIPSDLGQYTCVVTGTCGSETSTGGLLTVIDSIRITSDPISDTVCNGVDATFEVLVSSGNPTYLWQALSGTLPAIVNQASLTFLGSVEVNQGNYYCILSNGCGSVNSNTAHLEVNDNLTIVTPPVSISNACEGSTIQFDVEASGPTNKSYQWFKGTSILNNIAGKISGATSRTLGISNVLPTDEGSYSCDITSTCGSISTPVVTLDIDENVSYTTLPGTQSVVLNGTAVITVVASGSVVSYQWSGTTHGMLVNGGDISGASSSTLQIANADNTDADAYYCIITGTCNTVNTNSVTLTVLGSTVITTQPTSPKVYCASETLNVSIETSGTGNSYQWFRGITKLDNDGRIQNATTKALTITGLTTADAGNYTCVVNGTETSLFSNVTVNQATLITSNPADATRCAGDLVTFEVTATGGGVLAYQWYNNGGLIALATTDTYTINPLLDTDDNNIYCRVQGACGAPVNSSTAKLIVNAPTVLVTNPADDDICVGESSTLSLAVTGDSLTYQWYFGGTTAIAGANKKDYTLANAQLANQGQYSVKYQGACDAAPINSNFAFVAVTPNVLITKSPVSKTHCVGDNVVFTVEADGVGLAYQWFFDGNPVGLNSATYSIASADETHEGTYTCRVTGSCGAAVLSNPANLTIKTPIAITNPADKTICENSSTTFTVGTSGDIATYQWFFNTQAITDTGSFSGTKSQTLVIDNASNGYQGFYNCIVTGGCAQILTSGGATLTISPATFINVQPISVETCQGANLELKVQASGTGLTYLWYKNGTSLGQTASTLTLNNVTTAADGSYTCVVAGSCGGSLTSNQAIIKVIQPPVVSVNPTDKTICATQGVSFSITATGTDLIYQWKKSLGNVALVNNAIYSGVNSNELVLVNATVNEQAGYYCTVQNSCGTNNSLVRTLTVTPTTTITKHPLGASICAGQNITFTIEATGSNLNYEWSFNGSVVASGSNPFYTVTNIQPVNAGDYTCLVTGTCGNQLSNAAALTIIPSGSVTTLLADKQVCEDNLVVFSIETLGSNIHYQWIKNDVIQLTDNGNIQGAITKELRINLADASHAGLYRCDITSTCGPNSSNTAALSVIDSIKIIQHPANQTITDGGTAYFSVSANDVDAAYQWQFAGSNLSNGVNVSGAQTSTLTLSNVTTTNAGLYSCLVTSSCGSRISNAAVLKVNEPILVSSTPDDANVCVGSSVNFTVVASGVTKYQWYFGNSALNGAVGASYIINEVVPANAGVYTCQMTGNYGNIVRSDAKLVVFENAHITSSPSDATVCQGGDVAFKVMATGYKLTYQWQKDGLNISNSGTISGSQTDELIISNSSNTNVGVYRCLVQATGCNSEISSSAGLALNFLPAAAGTVSGKTTVCQGETDVNYTVAQIANATTYFWDLPYGATIVSGRNSRSIRVNFATDAQSGAIVVYGKNACGDGSVSSNFGVTVNALPYTNAGSDQLVCGIATSMAANGVVGKWTILSGDAVFADSSLFNSHVDYIKQGDNEFIWTVTQSGCVMRDTVTISNTTINVNAGVDQTICSKTTNLQALAPTSDASWKIISGSGIIANPLTSNSAISGLSQGLNQFAWAINNKGCESSDTVNIVNDLPKLPKAGVDQLIEFDETTLDATATESGTFGTWLVVSGSGSFENANDAKTKVTGLMPGNNILVWMVQRNNCLLTDTLLIENIAIDDPEAGPNQTICVNTARLAAVNPEIGIGEWSVISGAATFVNKNNSTTLVTNLGNGANVLKWTVRTSGMGVESDSVIITNNQASVANAGADVTLCSNAFTLNASTPQFGVGIWTLTSGSGEIDSINKPNSDIANLGQGTNELKWTITNENCTSDDFVKITNNTPTIANAGIDQTICTDSTILIPNTPSVGTASWSIVSGAGTFNSNSVTQLAPNQNILLYTITQGACRSTDDVIITNNKPTSPDAGYDHKICTDTLILGANLATQGEGIWKVISGSGNFENETLNNTKVSNISSGVNIYRWTIIKNGCEDYDELLVSNNFVSSGAGTDVTICSSHYQLLASNPNPGKGTWSVVGTSGAVFANQNSANSLVTNLSNGQNQLRWTVNNQGCISTDDVVVTNSNPTEARAGENQSVCGKEAELSANSPSFGDGLWVVMSGAGTFDDATNNQTTIRGLGEGKNLIRWIITEGECISYSEILIQSNLPENVFAGNDQIACSDTAVLSATTPTLGKGQWSIIKGSGSFDNPANPTTTIRKLGRGKNTLKWVVSSTDCHVADTVIISSNIPTKSVAGADQILCKDNTLMAGNTPLVGTGQWELVSGSAVIVRPSDPKSAITNIALGNSILRWTISEEGCNSSSELTLINNQPSQPFAGYDTEICADSVRLFATPVEIGSGRWTLVSGDAVVISPDSNQTLVQRIKFSENTFRWTVTHKNCVLTDDVLITNNLEYVNAGDDKEVNVPDIQLVANKPAQGTGHWEVSASPATIETPTSFETMVRGLGSGANVFTWTITNNGCKSFDDIIINYVVMPVADFTPSLVKGCPPMLVNFVNTSIGGEPYTWDFGDGTTSTEHSLWHAYTEPGTYKAVLTATAPLGQTVSKDTFITVFEIPTAKFEIAPDTIYIPGEHVSCFNYSTDAEINQWFFGDGTYITDYAPIYSYSDEGVYDITLKVTSKEGCVDSMTIKNAVEVLPRSDFFFPEAFTPSLSGGSGGAYDPTDRSNDVFYPIIIDGGLDEYELIIYNRLGVILFQTNDINIGWDGYYKDRLQPQDVYVFMVQGRYNNGQPFKIMGNVLLIVKEN